jgi:hypothetical protein
MHLLEHYWPVHSKGIVPEQEPGYNEGAAIWLGVFSKVLLQLLYGSKLISI